MITVTPSIQIDEREIEERFARASGPGGQNVNKVETAVQLRFNAKDSPAINRAVFMRLKKLAGQRMTADGILIIQASQFRSQDRNRIDALDRLIELIKKAAVTPKYRKPTRPTKASKTRRLDAKKKRGDTKKGRGRVSFSD